MVDLPASRDKQKSDLRNAALATRDALSRDHRAAAAQAVAARGLPFRVAPGTIIAGYSPIRSEFDPTPLMRQLAARGAHMALPVIFARDKPLGFRAWFDGDSLVRGPLGISEPSPDAADVVPDIFLVPMAAFDRSGHRIGYGAGHYDRSFAQLRAHTRIIAAGLAFAAQEIPNVPASSHDVRLDLLLTEKETIDFRSV